MPKEISVVDRYDYMATLSSSRWAWEAARRNDELCDDAHHSPPLQIDHEDLFGCVRMIRVVEPHPRAERWGLSFFPDPKLDAYTASAFWSDELYPRALAVECVPRQTGESDENVVRAINACEKIDHVINYNRREQILLRADGYVVQLRCEGLSACDSGPVRMPISFGALNRTNEKLRALEAVRAITRGTSPPGGCGWTRKSLALRNAMIALDCRKAGLGPFDTAAVIYGRARAEERWARSSKALRQEMVRALQRGQALRDGGYRKLLNGST